MRILYLSQVVPYPPDAGPKVRSYHVLQYLAGQHEVTLVAFSRPSDRTEAEVELRRYCQSVHLVPMPRSPARDAWHLGRALLSGKPFLVARDQLPAMSRLLSQLVRQAAGEKPYDVIHADQLWMAPYAVAAAAAAPAGRRPVLILDQHNAVYLIPQRLAQHEQHRAKRWLLRREARVMAQFEVEVCQRFDGIVWVTEEDRAAVARVAPRGELPVSRVIPICVDPEAKPFLERRSDARRVTFLGGLHWPPNAAGLAWFFREVWPRVRSEAPQAVLTVVGRNPPGELAQAEHVGVITTGYLPDPTSYLAETAAFIVPLHAGGGMRVKIVDAWSWGLPVVSTSIGAEGLRCLPGENILLADTAPEFAQAVLRLLSEPQLGEALAAAGRRTVIEHYDWRRFYPAFDEVYAGV